MSGFFNRFKRRAGGFWESKKSAIPSKQGEKSKITADFLLANQSDGYGDLAHIITMAFWQQFWGIAAGVDITVRMIMPDDQRPVRSPNGIMQIDEVKNFHAKYFCGVSPEDPEFAAKYQELLKQAFILLNTGVIKPPPGVNIKNDLSANDFNDKTPPQLLSSEDSYKDTVSPDFIFLGPNANLAQLSAGCLSRNLKQIYVYNQYNYAAPDAAVREGKKHATLDTLKSMILWPGKVIGVARDMVLSFREDPAQAEQLVTMFHPGIPTAANKNDFDGMVTPLPALLSQLSAECQKDLDSLEFAKKIFIYARLENLSELKNLLLAATKTQQDGQILLLIAGDAHEKIHAAIMQAIAELNKPELAFATKFTGFIANPAFNAIIDHPNLDAAYLTGDLSLSSGIFYGAKPRNKDFYLLYEGLTHTQNTALALTGLPEVKSDQNNVHTFGKAFRSPCGCESRMFADMFKRFSAAADKQHRKSSPT